MDQSIGFSEEEYLFTAGMHVVLFRLVDINIGGSGCKNVLEKYVYTVNMIWSVCLGINIYENERVTMLAQFKYNIPIIRNRLDIGSSRI